MKKTDYTEEETEIIKNTAKELLNTSAAYFSGHCTGIPAFEIMKEIMNEKLIAIHSGDKIMEV